MPALFAFGIPNYFNFTFRAGSQSSRLAEGITHVQSNPGDMTDSEADKEIKTIAHLPSHGTGNIESSPCGTLNKLPLEVRMLIYVKVLYYNKGSIKQPHRFLGRHPPILAKDCTHVEAIDAAILRTCKTIYRETIRILYGTNRFSFRKPTDIKDFAHAGLGDVPFGFYSITSKPSSAVNNAPCGRLTMIRLMTLKLNSIDDDDSLEEIWLSWSRFFYAPGKEDQLVDFPALEWLALDLRDWDLDTGDGSKIRVCSYFIHCLPLASTPHVSRRSASPVGFWTAEQSLHPIILLNSYEV